MASYWLHIAWLHIGFRKCFPGNKKGGLIYCASTKIRLVSKMANVCCKWGLDKKHVATASYCSICHSILGLAMVHPAFCISPNLMRYFCNSSQKSLHLVGDTYAVLSHCSTCNCILVTCVATAALVQNAYFSKNIVWQLLAPTALHCRAWTYWQK